MKKEQLKKVLRPIIKECLYDIIINEGLLSNVISEVLIGVSGANVIKEQRSPAPKAEKARPGRDNIRKNINESKKILLNSLNKDSYNGVNVFEGTNSVPAELDANNPLFGVSPGDPGIDISDIINLGGKNWSKLI